MPLKADTAYLGLQPPPLDNLQRVDVLAGSGGGRSPIDLHCPSFTGYCRQQDTVFGSQKSKDLYDKLDRPEAIAVR